MNCGCEQFVGRASEPSTEGKPFTEPLEKGWLGTALKEIRQTADSFEVPAPVAQVDAGKVCKYCKCSLPFGMTCTCFVSPTGICEPAVAQTELPPLEAYCYGPKNHNFYLKRDVDERIASLTQRLQASEAREAELKAEIAKMQMDNVIDYKAACEQHAANYEALERSHKALREKVIRHNHDFRCNVSGDGDGCLHNEESRLNHPCRKCGLTAAQIAAAEKL